MRKPAILFAILSTFYWLLVPAAAQPFFLSREMQFGEFSARAMWPEFGFAIVMLVGYFLLCLWIFGRVQKRAQARATGAE